MELYQVLEELERINELPLSQAVKPILEYPDNGHLYLEKFLLEMMQTALFEGVSKYWTYMYQRAMPLIESSINRDLNVRYKQLITNSNFLFSEENELREEQMLEQAKKKDTLLLFENLLDNLTSHYNLEPEFPELL